MHIHCLAFKYRSNFKCQGFNRRVAVLHYLKKKTILCRGEYEYFTALLLLLDSEHVIPCTSVFRATGTQYIGHKNLSRLMPEDGDRIQHPKRSVLNKKTE
jgi:hypothetical protein